MPVRLLEQVSWSTARNMFPSSEASVVKWFYAHLRHA